MNSLVRACIAEFIGTFALIFVGIGAISIAEGNLLAIAFAHGLTIAVFVSATMHLSGGQLNPAVTLGLLAGGKMTLRDSIAYWVAQLAGATLAAAICYGLFGQQVVRDGTPALAGPVTVRAGVAIELITSFFLVFVVYGTGVDSRGPKIGGLAIGLTVTLDILFAGKYTGAAMNPARVFGPALVGGMWKTHWVYWAGPMLGGLLAGIVYKNVFLPDTSTAK